MRIITTESVGNIYTSKEIEIDSEVEKEFELSLLLLENIFDIHFEYRIKNFPKQEQDLAYLHIQEELIPNNGEIVIPKIPKLASSEIVIPKIDIPNFPNGKEIIEAINKIGN